MNPQCGQLIKFRRPEKAGVYNVQCPHCGATRKMKLPGSDGGPSQPQEPEKPKIPDNSGKDRIQHPKDLLIDETHEFICPHCNEQEISLSPTVKDIGQKEVTCPYCKGKIGVYIKKPTIIIDKAVLSIPVTRGKLVLLRKFTKKEYPLEDGANVVGRYDESDMPDIAVKNDNTVSRRSIRIDVNHTEAGNTFKLTVQKATNPVLYNNQPLEIGESIYLNFGDTIILGKTKFRFEKDF